MKARTVRTELGFEQAAVNIAEFLAKTLGHAVGSTITPGSAGLWRATAPLATQYLPPSFPGSHQSDIAGLGRALGSTAKSLAGRPVKVSSEGLRFARKLVQGTAVALDRERGRDRTPPFELDPRDRRFADPAWNGNPVFFLVRQYFLAVNQLFDRLISDAELDELTERKARLAASLVVDLFA